MSEQNGTSGTNSAGGAGYDAIYGTHVQVRVAAEALGLVTQSALIARARAGGIPGHEWRGAKRPHLWVPRAWVRAFRDTPECERLRERSRAASAARRREPEEDKEGAADVAEAFPGLVAENESLRALNRAGQANARYWRQRAEGWRAAALVLSSRFASCLAELACPPLRARGIRLPEACFAAFRGLQARAEVLRLRARQARERARAGCGWDG